MKEVKNKIISRVLVFVLAVSTTVSMSGISSFAASGDTTVYITKTGKCYHNSGCSCLSKSCIETTLESASAKYTPCSKCKAPTLDSASTSTTTTTKAATTTKSTKKSTSSSKSSTTKTTSNDTTERTVWLSATGTKYHSKNNCGSMNPDKARSMSESDAKNAGYSACSKCCK